MTIRTFIAACAQGLCLTGRNTESYIRFDTLRHTKIPQNEVHTKKLTINVFEVNLNLRGSISHLPNDIAVL